MVTYSTRRPARAADELVPRSAPHRIAFVGVSILLVIYVSIEFTRPILRVPDELRVAEISREAVDGDASPTLTLNGEPFLEHPPPAYWLIGTSQRYLGMNEFAARLPSAIATLLVFVFTGIAALRFSATRQSALWAGLIAPALLAAIPGFARYCRRSSPDTWLVLFVTAGYAIHASWIRRSESDEPPNAFATLSLHAAAAAAFAFKGPVGPALIYAPVVLDVLWHRRLAWWRFAGHATGLAVVGGVGIFWAISVGGALGSSLFVESLWQNVVLRVFPSDEAYEGGHSHGPFYYARYVLVSSLPWSLLWVWLARRSRRQRQPLLPNSAARFLIVAPTIGLLLLSAVGTKRPLYLLPLWPAFGIALAIALAPVFVGLRWPTRRRLALAIAPIVISIVVTISLDSLRPKYDYRPLVRWLEETRSSGAPLASHGLDERARAAIPYYGSGQIDELSEDDQIRKHLRVDSGQLLIRAELESQLSRLGPPITTIGECAVRGRKYLLIAASSSEGAPGAPAATLFRTP